MATTKRGRIHIYAGDGKGKTTAAVGLAVRAAGWGERVLFVQFLKSGDSSEIKSLRRLSEITVLTGQKVNKFTFAMNEEEKAVAREECGQRLAQAVHAAERGEVDVLIMDETLGAIASGMLDEAAVLRFMETKPQALELVLTGRDPSEALIALADYYTEMRLHKHPYVSEGLGSRPGIEY